MIMTKVNLAQAQMSSRMKCNEHFIERVKSDWPDITYSKFKIIIKLNNFHSEQEHGK